MGKLTSQLFKVYFLIFLFFHSGFSAYSQVYDKNVADYISKVDHPFSFLKKYEELGVKQSGTSALDSACSWLMDLIVAEGYRVTIQKFMNGQDTLKNIEFIKKGSNDSCIVIGAHYDSWVGPGVNDNGTGDFAIYQFARLLKNLKTKYTIRFIYFSGEEVGFLGSKYYVSNLNKDSVKIKFMLNFDQLGGTIGEDNSAVKCERDEKSAQKMESNAVASAIAGFYNLYTNLTAVITPAYSSDYLPFSDSGYVIAGIYQYSPFPFYHTGSDLLQYIEFNSLISTVKGALASILHFSGAEVPAVDEAKIAVTHILTVYNTNNKLTVLNGQGYSMVLFDGFGREIFRQNRLSNESGFTLSSYSPGIYYAYFQAGENVTCKKFLVYP